MKLSIMLDQLSAVRTRAVQMVRKLGVAVGDEEESTIRLVAGEAIANCVEHGGCEVADLSAFIQNGDVVIAIAASCYDDQDEVASWLKQDCNKVDELRDRGRGVNLIKTLTKRIELHEGTIYLALNFATERSLVVA